MKRMIKNKKKMSTYCAVFLACVLGMAGILGNLYVRVEAANIDSVNGETVIDFAQKQKSAGILENIMNRNGDFTVLEIVPYKAASLFNAIAPDNETMDKIQNHAKDIFDYYYDSNTHQVKNDGSYTKNGDYEIVTTSYNNGILEKTRLQVIHDTTKTNTKDAYYVEYPRYFLESIVDRYTYPDYYEYFSNHINVIVITPDELNNFDFNNNIIDFVYVSSGGGDRSSQLNKFNTSINKPVGQFSLSLSQTYTYGCASNENGVKNDCSWDTVLKLSNMIYKGNADTYNYVTGKTDPIPCCFITESWLQNDYNISKFVTLMQITTNEPSSRVSVNGMAYNTYYDSFVSKYLQTKGNNSLGLQSAYFSDNSGSYMNWNNGGPALFQTRDQALNRDPHVYNYILTYNNNNNICNMYNLISGEESPIWSQSATDRKVATSQGFTTEQALDYLLGDYSVNGTKIKVLEIEPCEDFLYKDNLDNYKKIAKYLRIKGYSDWDLNTAKSYINVNYMTTAQFNGMNEDLISTYDLIIIGSQSGLINKANTYDSNYNWRYTTVYNDRSLNGYVYLAYGDLIKTTSALIGYRGSDYQSVSSSNISKGGFTVKGDTTGLNAQSKYIYSKYDESLWTPAVYSQLQRISGTYFVYKSVENTFKNVTNVSNYYANSLGNARFSDNDITEKKKSELMNYVNSGLPMILADNVYSGEVVYPTANLHEFTDSIKTKNNVIPDSYTSIKLYSIIQNTNLKITECTMRYDKDGDGVFDTVVPECRYSNNLLTDDCIIKNQSKFEYNVSMNTKVNNSYIIKLVVDKNADGKYNEEATTDDNNEVFFVKRFTANSRNTTQKFTITLPDGYNGLLSWRVVVVEAKNNSASRDIYNGYTAVTGDEKVINVLQIIPTDTTYTLKLTDRDFKNLIDKAASKINYKINIDCISANDYERIFAENPYTKGEFVSSSNYLINNDYSMVVIGFADLYGGEDISNDNGALDCIVDFIDKGYSVLFTHDTVGYANSVNHKLYLSSNSVALYNTGSISKNKWAVDMSRELRKIVGMDRYSVSELKTLDASNSAALNEAFVPKTKNGSYVNEIQGLNNFVLYRYAACNNFLSGNNISLPYSGLYTLTTTSTASKYGLVSNGNSVLQTTTKVEELNEGQINRYPYNTTTDGMLEVATTHAQWYQLDMEDEDVVVWYTLAGNDGTYYGDDTKDAGNNYYIYSKDNITYSGAGHSNMSSTTELELFVNTIVKAAVAGNFVPTVKVINGSLTNTKDEYIVYTNAFDDEIEVDFIARDDDLADRSIVENSYASEADILAHIGRFTVGKVSWIKDDGSVSELINYNKSNYVLNGENTKLLLNDKTNSNMTECYNVYKNTGYVLLSIQVSDSYGATGMCTVKLINHELFDLD